MHVSDIVKYEVTKEKRAYHWARQQTREERERRARECNESEVTYIGYAPRTDHFV